MKGIILANKKSTNLLPLTEVTSKYLLPIYNKPMIYYPLSVLMLAGIQEVLLIVNEDDQNRIEHVLGNGNQWGVKFSYKSVPASEGELQILSSCKAFIDNDSICVIAGDTILYGSNFFSNLIQDSGKIENGAFVFAYGISEEHGYDMIEIDEDDNPILLKKRNSIPPSNYAIPGIYFFDQSVREKVEHFLDEPGNHTEMIDLLSIYLQQNELRVFRFGRGFAWLDADSHSALVSTANFIRTIEYRQGLMIACPEEIAFTNGWITEDQLHEIVAQMSENEYRDYLANLLV